MLEKMNTYEKDLVGILDLSNTHRVTLDSYLASPVLRLPICKMGRTMNPHLNR